MTLAKTAEKTDAPESLPATAGTNLPDFLREDTQFAGAGMSQDQGDYVLPFLMIAQANSPQVKRQNAEAYIPGIEPGDIFNSATRQFWRSSEGLSMVHAHFQKAIVEWVPRISGGGYIGTHPPDTPLLSQTKSSPDGRMRLLPNGHQLVETAYHFVVLEDGMPAVLGLTSTGLGVSRQWMTLMKQFKMPASGTLVVAPSWSRVYRLTTIYRKKGDNDWFQARVEDQGWVGPQHRHMYEEAKQFWVAHHEQGVPMGKPPAEDGDGNISSEDNIPF